MAISILPDGTAGDISKVTDVELGVAFVRAQTKLFTETVDDLSKLVEKNRRDYYNHHKRKGGRKC